MRIALGWAVLALLAPAGLAAQNQSPQEQEPIRVENAWNAAIQHRDTTALNRLYAHEFYEIDYDGAVYTKEQDLAMVATGEFQEANAALTDLRVRVYGETAVVNGLNTISGTFRGQDVSGAYRFTDVFVRRQGRWQCVVTQSTLVAHR